MVINHVQVRYTNTSPSPIQGVKTIATLKSAMVLYNANGWDVKNLSVHLTSAFLHNLGMLYQVECSEELDPYMGTFMSVVISTVHTERDDIHVEIMPND